MVCHTILELRIFPIRTIILKGWHMPKATSFNGENLSHSTASLRSYLDMVECWQRTVSCVIYPLAMCLPNRHLCKRETYSAPAELMISCRNTIRVTGDLITEKGSSRAEISFLERSCSLLTDRYRVFDVSHYTKTEVKHRLWSWPVGSLHRFITFEVSTNHLFPLRSSVKKWMEL